MFIFFILHTRAKPQYNHMTFQMNLNKLNRRFAHVKRDGFCWNHAAFACLYDDKTNYNKRDDFLFTIQKLILPMRNMVGLTLQNHPEWMTQECMTQSEWEEEIENLVGKLPRCGDERYASFLVLRALCVTFKRNGIILINDERDAKEHALPSDYVAFLSCDPNQKTYKTYDASGSWLNCYDTYKMSTFMQVYESLSKEEQEACMVFIFNGVDHFDTALPASKMELFQNPLAPLTIELPPPVRKSVQTQTDDTGAQLNECVANAEDNAWQIACIQRATEKEAFVFEFHKKRSFDLIS